MGVHVVLVSMQLVLTLGTFMLPAFERVVAGSLGKLLLSAGIDFTSYISLWSLPKMTARRGGLDYLMAGTFTVFIIVGPLARSLTLLVLLLVPMRVETARWLFVQSRRLVAYTALDVMILATPLIGTAFGPMTKALVDKTSVPACALFDQIYDTGETCLEINVIPQVMHMLRLLTPRPAPRSVIARPL